MTAIEKVIYRLKTANKIKRSIANRNLLLTEKVPLCKGIEFIEPIMKAIIENQKIIFDYTKFEDANSKKRTLAPILLKRIEIFGMY